MGLFSSKYTTSVATNAARVIEDNTLPDSIKHGILKGLVENDDQLVENILEELVSGIGIKADNMYNYGRDHYAYGLPNGDLMTAVTGQDTVKSLIQLIVGKTVTLDYYHFGALNNLHMGWYTLTHQYNYNVKTNIFADLTVAKGKPVKLSSIAVVVTEASLLELSNGSLDQWDNPIMGLGGLLPVTSDKLFELDAAAANDYLRVTYTWDDDVVVVVEGVNITRKQTLTGTLTISLAGFNQDAEWHQAKYTRADGEVGYFTYEAGIGSYPELDTIFTGTHSAGGQYFPWAYFRVDAVSGNKDKTSDIFKQSKKLVSYIGLNYEQVTDAIDQNPDIANVQQAIMMMGVPAVTTTQIEMRYLFDFFSRMLDNTGGDLSAAQPYKSGGSLSESIKLMLDSSQTDAAILIQDAKFKMGLGFRHISRTIIQGTIGAVGVYTSGWLTETITEKGTNTNGGTPVTWNTTVKTHWYRKQTTATQYEEVRVNNLKEVFHVFGDYTTTADEDDDFLLIPIDRSITKKYAVKDRELLYARSLHYVFNSKQITEVKWYQQGWFRAFMIVVAIVITVISYGSAWQALGAAVAAGTVTMASLVYMIAIAALKYLAINLAIKLFVKIVGVKFAFIVAIVAAVAGAYQAIDAGSISGAPWAKELLQVSTGLTSGIGGQLKADYADLAADADTFSTYEKEQQTKLDAANALLDTNTWMTPLIVFGEKPNDFYQRTVHSGNIGPLSIDVVSSFVDMRLQLPTLSDTI